MRLIEQLTSLFQAGKRPQPDIPFGRYTDAYKTPEQQEAWERALKLFDEGKTLDAYRAFFQYLRDDKEDNVTIKDEGKTIFFEIRQGSGLVSGSATQDKVTAESRVAKVADLNLGFLRRLMEHNFTLRFCRFALTPDNCVAILFDTHTVDGSPYKLMYALRELAIHADKQDDLLLDEFSSVLQPVAPSVGGTVSEAEKKTKYEYMRREIAMAFAEMDKAKPDPNQYPGGYAYYLLGLAFRLDYLIRPEGFMMDRLEQIHTIYFNKDEKSPQLKVLSLRKEFQKLLDRDAALLFKEMYRTRSTFGISPSVNHERIKNLIEGELPNMDWHLSQKYDMLALGIPRYIVGYALFHFSPPKPDRELFHLFYQITEWAYFQELGFQFNLTDGEGKPLRVGVEKAIREIMNANRTAYPKMKPDLNKLNYASMQLFAKSYLEMIKDLDLAKVE